MDAAAQTEKENVNLKLAVGSSNRYTVPLSKLERTDASTAGGKGAHLGALAAAGFDVPPGFVLITEAFTRFVAANRLDVSTVPEDVLKAQIPEEVRQALAAAVAQTDNGPWAVRSSAVGEDAADASFAGQYETVLNVDGAAVADAVRCCWASAFSPRLAEYRKGRGASLSPMAVVVQRMLQPDAAGVAFTANPVTGDRTEALVSAVRGVGERLVSGEAAADEWVVRGERAECRRSPECAVDAEQVRRVAELARKVEAHFGAPQDIEWAFASGKLWLLQARPITALPDAVEWKSPLPGGWIRNFRLGEWLPEPVTPLFESWLLPRLESAFNEFYRRNSGIRARGPDHVLINGWFFGSLNFVPSPPVMIWELFTRLLPKLVANGKRAFATLPPLHARCIDIFIEDWRALRSRYRAEVGKVRASLDAASPAELIAAIEQLADLAGDYFGHVSLVSGYAWKVEVPLADFYRRTLEPRLGGTHAQLLQGLFVPARAGHDVQSLDWLRPTAGEMGLAQEDDAEPRRARLERSRKEAERRAREVLASEPKLLARFEALLAQAQRFAPIRDEQVSEFTLAWPVMRAALARIGHALLASGHLRTPEQVHFLTREELERTLGGAPSATVGEMDDRRRLWERRCRLAPPLLVGEARGVVKSILAKAEASFRPEAPDASVVTGMPASPGRATGPARIIRSIDDFDRFRDGDVLVAPATMPAWTPLFSRAAAVVTDVGSVIAHAALVAREYGIPAVVGTGNATATLRDGEVVTVDGTRGGVLRA